MKTKLITIALIAITCITSQLFAQESGAKTTGNDLKKNVKCIVSTGETGYSIAFEYDVKAPRDVATGQSSGKKGYDSYQEKSEYIVIATNNSVTEVSKTRDPASGLPTGKRMHKPFTITKELDKSSPLLVKTGSSSETEPEVNKTKDPSRGQATGRRQHRPVEITKDLDKTSPKLIQSVSGSETEPEVNKTKDPSRGQATGRRQHRPVEITKDLDKSAPKLIQSVSSSEISTDPASATGSGKANLQDFHGAKATFKEFTITKRCGEVSTKYSVVDGECVIPMDDCPNGVCTLTADWSWGTSNPISSVDFFLKIEDGACTAMAINEKGLPGDKKPIKSSTNNPK